MNNKQAMIRYRVIDRCLRNQTELWNWQSLAEACVKELTKSGNGIERISERTIKGDISNMKKPFPVGYNAPIIFDRSNGINSYTYRYNDPSFSLTESLLSPKDASQMIAMMTQIRKQIKLEGLNSTDTVFQKLSTIIPEANEPSVPAFHLESIPEVPGAKWFDQLFISIRQKKTINMTYRKFNNDPKSYIISPYMLKEYQNRWYLFGWSHKDNDLRTYGIERIENITDSFTPYEPNTTFNPTEYFKDIVGISRMYGVEKQRVIFRAYDYQRFYVDTKPIHHSQFSLRSTDTYIDFAIDVIPNRELEMALLALGEEIEILEPLSLRKSAAERVRKTAERYKDV